MDVLVLLLLLISSLFGGSGAIWCLCRNGTDSASLQKALDYACGAGADCSPILQNGACYEPNTVQAHCSYAANSYFQRQNQADGSCNFAGSATVVTYDPSYAGCSYPANFSAAGTGSTPSSSSPGPTSPGTPTGTLSPPGFLGLGPSGTTGIPTDGSGVELLKAPAGSVSVAVVFSGLVLLGGRR